MLVRRRLPPPASVQVYELTPWGYEAAPIFQALGRWAARSPAHDPTLPFSPVSIMLSLRTMFERGSGRRPRGQDPAFASATSASSGSAAEGRDSRSAAARSTDRTSSSRRLAQRASPAMSMAARRSTRSRSRATCELARALRRPCSRCRPKAQLIPLIEALRAPRLRPLAMTDIPNVKPDSRSRHRPRLARQDGEGARAVRRRQRHGGARRSARPTSAFPTSTRPMSSIRTRRWRSAPASRSNRRVMVQGYHGTGKSTHIEQVAARLNWPMIRINLDAHISRIDLDRPRRDRASRRPAGHRIPRRPAALGAAASGRAGVRRI